MTDFQIKEKLDSILFEGNLLYRYEKAAWISTDMAREKSNIKKDFFNYLVYHDRDTVHALILNNKLECIYELRFVFQSENPILDIVKTRSLSVKEQNLFSMKSVIINKIVEQKIPVGYSEGYSLNTVLMPREDGYKLYFISGTSRSGVIPFGNDYLFLTDNSGNIQFWKKFHSRLIALEAKGPNGELITEMIHSHLKTEPFITATDICTFMLYGKLCGQKSFQVYSTERGKYFRYLLDKNSIEIVEN